MFPTHIESVALRYCESYDSVPVTYVRVGSERESSRPSGLCQASGGFAKVDESECGLIERLFCRGIDPKALLDALDEGDVPGRGVSL